MKKNLILKTTALLTMLALALVIIGVPGTAHCAAINGVTITHRCSGESYNIPVGGTVESQRCLRDRGTFDIGRVNLQLVGRGRYHERFSFSSASGSTARR